MLRGRLKLKKNKINKKALLIATSIVWVPICIAVVASCLNLMRYGSINKPKELIEQHKQSYSNSKNSNVEVNGETNKISEELASSSSGDLSHIKVKITGLDGKEYYLDKGLFKDQIKFNQDVYVEVSNESTDSKFVGAIHFNGASILDQYGTLEVLPGQSQQLKVTFSKDDATYSLDGEMIKVVDNSYIDKYKVLGSKTRNMLVGQAVYCGIEIPDSFTEDDTESILNDFIESYSSDMTVEMLTVYVYEKGYVMSDTTDMYKNAIYILDAYLNDDGTYSYSLSE